VEGQFATGAGGVDPFRQRPKTDFSLTEPFHCLDKLFKRPGHAIQLPNHETVSGPRIIERRLELRPVVLCTGSSFLENLLATGSFERVELKL